MAEGGGDFGYDDPKLDHDIDHDDDDDDEEQEVNTTYRFQPGAASTPHTKEFIELQNMVQKEKDGLEEPVISFDEIPSLVGFKEVKEGYIERAKNYIKDKFPKVDFGKIGPIGYGKLPENENTIVSFSINRKGEAIEEPIFKKTGDKGLLKKFKDKFKGDRGLGPEAESLIAEDNKSIRDLNNRVNEAEKQAQQLERTNVQLEKTEQEKQDLIIRLERAYAKIDELGSNVENEAELRRQQMLVNNYKKDIENAEKEVAALKKQQKQLKKVTADAAKLKVTRDAKLKERNTMEKRLNSTKTFDELKELDAELERQIEEDKLIIDDEETSPSDKEAARERVAEAEDERARLRPQFEERERAMPWWKRLGEIFKKYGLTVTSISLAAAVVIEAIVMAVTKSAFTKALKSTAKNLGNGLKELGKK